MNGEKPQNHPFQSQLCTGLPTSLRAETHPSLKWGWKPEKYHGSFFFLSFFRQMLWAAWPRQLTSCSGCKQAGTPEQRPNSVACIIYSRLIAQPERKPKSPLLWEGQHVLITALRLSLDSAQVPPPVSAEFNLARAEHLLHMVTKRLLDKRGRQQSVYGTWSLS